MFRKHCGSIKHTVKMQHYSNFTNNEDLYDDEGDQMMEIDHKNSGHFTIFTIVISSLYIFLLFFGIAGNAWVITVIGYILKSFKGLAHNPSIFLYILSLSIADSLMLTIIPMLITDIINENWIFGPVLCKLYWIIESVNKLVSKLILTAMAFERYLAVCRPYTEYRIRSVRGTCFVLFCITVFVFCSMCPVYLNTSEYHFFENLYPDTDIVNESSTTSTSLMPRTKCTFTLGDVELLAFTMYLFVAGFCLPSVMITFLYANILLVLRRGVNDRRSTSGTKIPLRKTARYTLMVILVDFVCWTPYWIVVLYLGSTHELTPKPYEIYVMYLSHFLVYVNSAVNWILYAYLNRNLKDSRVLAGKRNAEMKSRLINNNFSNSVSLVSKRRCETDTAEKNKRDIISMTTSLNVDPDLEEGDVQL